MDFATFDRDILYLARPELFKAGDSWDCWDVVSHGTLARLRLEPDWVDTSYFWVILLSGCFYAIQALQD